MKREYQFTARSADTDKEITIYCREWQEGGRMRRKFVTRKGTPLRHAAPFVYVAVSSGKHYLTQPDGVAPTDMEDSNPWDSWTPGTEW